MVSPGNCAPCSTKRMMSVHSQKDPMLQDPFFHEASGTVRFWVLVNDRPIGASIGKETLHYRYESLRNDDEPLATYTANAAEIDTAVRRRIANGSMEPVMLRDMDVRQVG